MAESELRAAARDMLRMGQHDGPCVNYAGQDPEEYSSFDSCESHMAAAQRRRDRLEAALAEQHPSEHLGKQVTVTLAYHDEDVSDAPVVAKGLFLAFGDYGEVVLQGEDGALQFCWPMLEVKESKE